MHPDKKPFNEFDETACVLAHWAINKTVTDITKSSRGDATQPYATMCS